MKGLAAAIFAVVLCAAGTVAGKWTFAMETEGGPRRESADFALEGDQVTGRWGHSNAKGTFRDGKLEMSFPVDSAEAGRSAVLTLSGQLEGDVITGTWKWESHSGTFRATRTE